MRMEQAQPGIRNGPGVAMKFSIVDCDLQAFLKAFFRFPAILLRSVAASVKPPKGAASARIVACSQGADIQWWYG